MKNLQYQILLIFFLIGITIILGMGFFFTNVLNQSNSIVLSEGNTISTQEINHLTEWQMNQTKILIFISILVFSCIIFIMGIFISKVIIMPINKLIKNAKKIASGENVELIKIDTSKKKRKKIGRAHV